MSRLRVYSRYGRRFLVILILENPFTDVNRIFLVRAGRTYHTGKVGDLVPQYFLSSQLGIMVYAIETNLGPQYDSEGSSQCWYTVIPATSSRTFELTFSVPQVQTAHTKRAEAWLPSPAGLGNQGKYTKVNRGINDAP